MCGIAGCAAFGLREKEAVKHAESFISAMHHRGPDGNGYWFNKDKLLLTHNRLAIVDLSSNGHQPMESHAQRFVLTFNGEIYNFREIRQDLESQGVQFRGHSDTEVILASIEERGLDKTLSLLNGMFAFALYDREQDLLTIARDRMGEKPLYYGWLNGRFIFASELKAIVSYGLKLKINSSVIGDFLSFGYIPTPYTIYQNIFKLTPGCYLTLNGNKNFRPKGNYVPDPGSENGPIKYWCLDQIAQGDTDFERPITTQDLSTSLEETISRQLVADVPVGCFLSGGIDSSLVTAVAQKVSNRPIRSFTVGFDSKEFNEAHFAKEIALYLGTEHFETYVTHNDVLKIVESLPHVYDEPFADPSQLPSILVSKIAKETVSVCLSGDGGDELFAGYNRYASTIRYLQMFRRVPLRAKKALVKVFTAGNSNFFEKLVGTLRSLPGFTPLQQANIGLKLRKLAKLLEASSEKELYLFLIRFNGFERPSSLPETTLEKRIDAIFTADRDFLSSALLLDQLNYLVDDNLVKVDRSGMTSSLETRLPLLDKEIVEMSWQFSPEEKIKNGKTKAPLRDVLYQLVPKELLERPKMGFSVPVSSWLRKELNCWAEQLLNTPELGAFVDIERYLSAWEEHNRRTRDHGLYLWPVLILAQWLTANSKHLEEV